MIRFPRSQRFALPALLASLAVLLTSLEASASMARGDCSKKMGKSCCCVGARVEARCLSVPTLARTSIPANLRSIPSTRISSLDDCECQADPASGLVFINSRETGGSKSRTNPANFDGLVTRGIDTVSSQVRRRGFPPFRLAGDPLRFRMARLQV